MSKKGTKDFEFTKCNCNEEKALQDDTSKKEPSMKLYESNPKELILPSMYEAVQGFVLHKTSRYVYYEHRNGFMEILDTNNYIYDKGIYVDSSGSLFMKQESNSYLHIGELIAQSDKLKIIDK